MQTVSLGWNKFRVDRLLAILFGVVCLRFCVSTVHATPIDIDLSGSPRITADARASLTTLNGMALQGQTLSLDFQFLNGSGKNLQNCRLRNSIKPMPQIGRR